MVVESQARLITSNNVLLQVIRDTNLEKDPEFGGGDSRSMPGYVTVRRRRTRRAEVPDTRADTKRIMKALMDLLPPESRVRPADAGGLATTLPRGYKGDVDRRRNVAPASTDVHLPGVPSPRRPGVCRCEWMEGPRASHSCRHSVGRSARDGCRHRISRRIA